MESSNIDPTRRLPDAEKKDLEYSQLVNNGGLSDTIPQEIIQEILLKAEISPRSEVDRAMLNRVVTIYKDKKCSELQDVVKSLIAILNKFSSRPTVSEVIKDLAAYLETLPIANPFSKFQNRTDIQEHFYGDIKAKLKKLTDDDVQLIFNTELYDNLGKYITSHVMKLFVEEFRSRYDIPEFSLTYLIMVGNFKELFSVLDDLPAFQRQDRKGVMQPLLINISKEPWTKKNINEIYQAVEYMNKTGIGWVDMILRGELDLDFDDKHVENPVNKQMNELCDKGEYEKAIALAEQQNLEIRDSVKIDLALALLVKGKADLVPRIVDTLPESDKKEALLKLIDIPTLP